MRLIKVSAPQGQGKEIAQIAFQIGISQVALHQQEILKPQGASETVDVIDLEMATPTAKVFVDALLTAPNYNPQTYSLSVRQARSILSREAPRKITRPLVEPASDIFEELWQFSHLTVGFVGRIFIAALLLAYGLIEANLLLLIAGLLFLPLLPLLLAISFGLLTKSWRLAGQGLMAFVVALGLMVTAGLSVALVTSPPIKFNDFHSPLISALISAGVGIAAGLATADDAGRREMIGLAATAQIALIPVWCGLTLIFGRSPLETSPPSQKALTLVLNVAVIILSALGTYASLGIRGKGLYHFLQANGNH